MATSNERILHDILRRQIYLERYKNGLVASLKPVLRLAISDMRRRVEKLPENATKTHLRAALREITEISTDMSGNLNAKLQRELERFAKLEAGFAHAAISAAIPASVALKIAKPSASFLTRMVTTEPFHGLVLEEWTKRIGQSATLKARQQLFIGLAEGEGVYKLQRRLAFIGDQAENDFTMVARTAVNAVSNQSKSAVYSENSDVIAKVMWRSTLDGRTSEICAARDGETYPVDDHPTPPAHPNCRSVIVPVIKSLRELGLDRDDFPPGTRASMNGQVPGDETYNTWLRKQPQEFVEEVLGPERARLYLEEKLSVDKFVNDFGQRFTLDQLEAKYPSKF